MATTADTTEAEVRTGLRMPVGLHDDLRAVAQANDRSMNAEARRAIAAHVRRELDHNDDAAQAA